MHKHEGKVEDSSNNRVSTQPQDSQSKRDNNSQGRVEFTSQNNFLNHISSPQRGEESMNLYGEDIDENAQQGSLNPKQVQKRLKDKAAFHFLHKEVDVSESDHFKSPSLSLNQSPMNSFHSNNGKYKRPIDQVKEEYGIEAQVSNLQKQNSLQLNGNQKQNSNEVKLGLKKNYTLNDFTKRRTINESLVMEYNQKVIRQKTRFNTHVGLSKQESGPLKKSNKVPVLYAKSIVDLLEIEEIQSQYKRLRRAIFRFIDTIYYRIIMIAVCCINIAGYAMHDYSGRLSLDYVDENVNSLSDDINLITEICFIVEIAFEMIARGFFRGKKAFFKDAWLVCNLVSIICSGITQFSGLPNVLYMICRILSMLRPLRIIQMITPLRTEFERLLRSIPKINISIWRLVIFMVFYAIVGLHIFDGALEYRCRVTSDPPSGYNDVWEVYEDIPYLCGRWVCPDQSYCRSPYEYDRPLNKAEDDIANLNYGYTNFDNFGQAFFTVFHIVRIISFGKITFIYWREASTVLVASYFLSLVLICSYVLSNIILGELYESFEEQRSIKSYAEYRIQQKQEKEKSTKVNIKDIELEYQKQMNQDIPEGGEIVNNLRSPQKEKIEFILEEEFENEDEGENQEVCKQNNDQPNQIVLSNRNCNAAVQIPANQEFGTEQIIHNENQQILASKATLSNQTASVQENQNPKIEIQNKQTLFHQLYGNEVDSNNDKDNKKQLENNEHKEHDDAHDNHHNNSNQINSNSNHSNQEHRPHSQSIKQQPKRMEHIHVVENYISEEKLVEQKTPFWEYIDGYKGILSIFFRLAILLDLVVICADRASISDQEAEIYVEIDWIILWIFTAEIAIKRLDFFKDVLNDIDLLIFGIRFIATNYSLFSGSPVTSEIEYWIHAVKAINVFRIFQVVKNTAFFRTVNNLIFYFYNTIIELIYYILIIIFYCGLFALIGHDLFAHKAEFINGDQIPADPKTGQPPQMNYDSFLNSFEAVFYSVLNEQWNLQMYNYMRSIGDYVCSFWIIIICTGEIFVLKLLMALFINTFLKHFNSRKKDKNDEKEEAKINDIVRNQVMSAKTMHHGGHGHGHHEECFIITFCRKLENDHRFENFIMCIIIINIVVMAVDSPLLDHHDPTKVAIHYLEMFFTGIYGAEILIKLIACGLFQKGGYFRDPKNYFDFSLFCLNIAGFIFSSKLGILNALRAFHIVVLSKHFESLRIILVSLTQAIPYLCKLLFFAFCFLLVLAVIPLRILKGKMYNCVTIDDSYLEFVVTQNDCFDLGGDWVKADFHYDNILYSLFNLFIIASCEGWSYFSFTAQNAVGVKLQPIEGYGRAWSVFFFFQFFIGNIMVINAFTGVMTQKFNEINGKFLANQMVIPIKDKKFLNECSSIKFTEKVSSEEQEWLSIKRSIYRAQPIRTFEEPNSETHKLQFWIYQIISHKGFEIFINLCTILSTVIFGIYYHRESSGYTDMLNSINDVIVLIYVGEIMLKLFVERKQFFYNKNNFFLLFILITSIIPTAYRFSQEANQVNIYFKLLEVFRILRLINTIPMIQSIFSMMSFILPQVAPIAAVYLFTIYIYALFGMNLFGFIKPQVTLNGYDLHFKNFTSSVFTLIRVSTGESWFYIVPDVVREQQPNFICFDVSDVEAYQEFGLMGCGTTWGYIYFFSFHLIVSVIIFNLFIAVLLGLIKTQNTAVSKYQLSQIKDLWRAYDRKGYGFIDYKNFWQFTSRIAMIYGVKKDDLLDPNQKKNFLKFLSLPIYSHKRKDHSIFGFRFHDVVVKMTQISLFLKYGILPGGKEESQNTLSQFYKELDAETKFVGELSTLKSGDIAVIILIQRKIKLWMRKGKELYQLRKNQPEEYLKNLKNTQLGNQVISNLKRVSLLGVDQIFGLRGKNQKEAESNAAKIKLIQKEDQGSSGNKSDTSPILVDETKPKQETENVIRFSENSDESASLTDQSENFRKSKVDENQRYSTSKKAIESTHRRTNNVQYEMAFNNKSK